MGMANLAYGEFGSGFQMMDSKLSQSDGKGYAQQQRRFGMGAMYGNNVFPSSGGLNDYSQSGMSIGMGNGVMNSMGYQINHWKNLSPKIECKK